MRTTIKRTVTVAAILLTSAASCLRAQTWDKLGSGLGPNNCDNNVAAVLVFGGELYAGGQFTAPAANVARWDGAVWNPVGGDPGKVGALAALNGILYACSGFNQWFLGVKQWDSISWSVVGTGGPNGVVYALATKGGKLYAGGAFSSPGNNMAYFDTATWNGMATDLTGTVYAVAITDDGTIYAGGQSSSIAFVKKWNGSMWVALPDGPSGGPSPIVYALTAKGNDLYVGGTFTTVGPAPGIAVRGLAKWNGTAWSGFATPPWKPSDDAVRPGTVRAIAWNGPNQMYVTGELQNSTQPSTKEHIFLLENGQWSTTAVSPGLKAGCGSTHGSALAVDRYAGKVYVGGFFDTAGGVLGTLNVAVWNDFEPITIVELCPYEQGAYIGTNTTAYGINNLGKVAGYGDTDHPVAGTDHAFLWTLGSCVPTDIDSVGSQRSLGFAINDNDLVTGYSYYSTAGDWRAFRRDPNANPTWVYLGTLTGSFSQGSAINKGGMIAGQSQNALGVNRAARWAAAPNTDPVNLLSLDGNFNSESLAYGVNSVGRIVGRSLASGGQTHAFKTGINGAQIQPTDDLGTLPGGTYSAAYGINDFDEVVGASTVGSTTYAVLSKPGKKFSDPSPDNPIQLAPFPGESSASGLWVNNVGMVVGSASWQGSQKAFVYQKTWSAIQKLDDLLAPGSGWDLRSAEGISDDGKIAGWGYHSGLLRGFLIDPSK